MPNMYGPAQDGTGTIVNRVVPETDVEAYKRAGYKFGTEKAAPTSEEYGKQQNYPHVDAQPEAGPVDLSLLTKAELLDYAKSQGVDVVKSATKDEIVAAIEGVE